MQLEEGIEGTKLEKRRRQLTVARLETWNMTQLRYGSELGAWYTTNNRMGNLRVVIAWLPLVVGGKGYAYVCPT